MTYFDVSLLANIIISSIVKIEADNESEAVEKAKRMSRGGTLSWVNNKTNIGFYSGDIDTAWAVRGTGPQPKATQPIPDDYSSQLSGIINRNPLSTPSSYSQKAYFDVSLLAKIIISSTVKVEADNENEAIEKAKNISYNGTLAWMHGRINVGFYDGSIDTAWAVRGIEPQSKIGQPIPNDYSSQLSNLISKNPTSTSLQFDVNVKNVPYSQEVTITSHVTSKYTTPVGLVSFYDLNAPESYRRLNYITVSNNGVAELTTRFGVFDEETQSSNLGYHSIYASYEDTYNGGFMNSISSTIPINVVKAKPLISITTLTVASEPEQPEQSDQFNVGSSMTIRVKVSNTESITDGYMRSLFRAPTGKISLRNSSSPAYFQSNLTLIKVGNEFDELASECDCTISDISSIGSGPVDIVASYDGDENYVSTLSPLKTISINRIPVTIEFSTNSIDYKLNTPIIYTVDISRVMNVGPLDGVVTLTDMKTSSVVGSINVDSYGGGELTVTNVIGYKLSSKTRVMSVIASYSSLSNKYGTVSSNPVNFSIAFI